MRALRLFFATSFFFLALGPVSFVHAQDGCRLKDPSMVGGYGDVCSAANSTGKTCGCFPGSGSSCTVDGTECVSGGANQVSTTNKPDCKTTDGKDGFSGVLVDCIPAGATFWTYLNLLLDQNGGLVIAAAVIYVVFSGVQYMLALGNTTNQVKAKTRIVSIVSGIILYTLIRFIIGLLAGGIL